MRPGHRPVFAKAHLRKAIVQMVEEHERSGKAEHTLGLPGRKGGGKLRRKKPGHAVPEPAQKRTCDGGKRGGFRFGQKLDAAHGFAQTLDEGHTGKGGKFRKAFIFHRAFKAAFTAGEHKGHIAGKHAVAPPAPIDLGAFQQDAAAPGHAEEEAYGRIHIGGEPADALAYPDDLRIAVHGFQPWSR